MTFRHLALPALLAAVALPALAAGAGPLAGQYRVTTIMTGQTQPTIRYACFEGGENSMFSLPEADAATRCTLQRNVVRDGRIDIARNCTDSSGRASTGVVTGTWSDTGFSMHARIAGEALTAPVEVRSVGRRVAAVCAAG